jgi:hypothetical protein
MPETEGASDVPAFKSTKAFADDSVRFSDKSVIWVFKRPLGIVYLVRYRTLLAVPIPKNGDIFLLMVWLSASPRAWPSAFRLSPRGLSLKVVLIAMVKATQCPQIAQDAYSASKPYYPFGFRPPLR